MELPQARALADGHRPGPSGRELPRGYVALLWMPVVLVASMMLAALACVHREFPSWWSGYVGWVVVHAIFIGKVLAPAVRNQIELVRHGIITAAEMALVQVPKKGTQMRLTYTAGHHIDRPVHARPKHLVMHLPARPEVAFTVEELAGAPTLDGDRLRLTQPWRRWILSGAMVLLFAVGTIVKLS